MFKRNIVNTLTYILLCAVLLSFTSCGLFGSGGDETDPPISVTPFAPDDDPLRVQTEPKQKDDPKPVTPPETTAPETTKAPETTPAETTTAPETEPPVEDVNYEGRNMSLSGRINPTDSNNIELHLEWTATQKADSPYATVTVKVFLDCYDIYINSRDNSVISINGEEKTFPTKIISINNNKLNSVELHSESVQILSPLGETVEVPVSAMFYFGGKYGSKTFDWLKVSGTITLKDTSSLVPEKPVTPNEN